MTTTRQENEIVEVRHDHRAARGWVRDVDHDGVTVELEATGERVWRCHRDVFDDGAHADSEALDWHLGQVEARMDARRDAAEA